MEVNILRVLATTAIIVFLALIGGAFVYYYGWSLPDWIILVVVGSVAFWGGEFIDRLVYRRRGILWGAVKSRQDKLVVACGLAVIFTFSALPLRLGISSGWIKFLMTGTGLVLGYAIWRCFGSPDITRPDKSRTEADEG